MGDNMKKLVLSVLMLCVFSLTACSHTESVNLFHFTENLNASYGYERASLSDYMIKDGEYTLLFNDRGTQLLLTLFENEQTKIKKFRLTVSKTDNSGKPKVLSDDEAELFFDCALHTLSAYSIKEKADCESILRELLPQSGKDCSKIGELTASWHNFSLVFYSNELCCQFFVTDNYLEAPEETSKPVSRPLYGQTANTRQD